MLLCTLREEPKHPHIPTFDHVSAYGIKISLNRLKYPGILELLRPKPGQELVSGSGRRDITWSNSPKLLASSAVI
jgi:hypothetical protein